MSSRCDSAFALPVSTVSAAAVMASRTLVCVAMAVSSLPSTASRAAMIRSCAAVSVMSGRVIEAMLFLSDWKSVICWLMMLAWLLRLADVSEALAPALSSVVPMVSATAW